MRTIVIGDVHGCYEELMVLMRKLKGENEYNEETDKLIFLGDYVDRGPDSKKVVDYVRELQKNNDKVIALCGNHEDMMIKFHANISKSWIYNGFEATIKSYKRNEEDIKDAVDWMITLPIYHEDDHFVYVHAGVVPGVPMGEQDPEDLLWTREEFIFNPKKHDKKVIFGHTPSLYVKNNHYPYSTEAENFCIDTGCVYGGRLTALIIEDDEIKKFIQVTRKD